MTVVEMRAVLLTEIDELIQDEGILQRLKKYVSRIKREAKAHVSDKPISLESQKTLDRLDSFSQLRDGWDGEDAFAIERKSISNARALVECANPSDLSKWLVFPNTNGTVLLTRSDDVPASINIGNQGFSYFYENDGSIEVGEESSDFANLPDIFSRLSSYA